MNAITKMIEIVNVFIMSILMSFSLFYASQEFDKWNNCCYYRYRHLLNYNCRAVFGYYQALFCLIDSIFYYFHDFKI